MMPSAATANPYDNDALERDDLIDPDDGEPPTRPCSIAAKLSFGLSVNVSSRPGSGKIFHTDGLRVVPTCVRC